MHQCMGEERERVGDQTDDRCPTLVWRLNAELAGWLAGGGVPYYRATRNKATSREAPRVYVHAVCICGVHGRELGDKAVVSVQK